MKRLLLLILLLPLQHIAKAQDNDIDPDNATYAIIKDADGYVNVRKSPDSNSPIVGKIYNDEIFLSEHNTANWWKIERLKSNTIMDGYISKNRIQLLKFKKMRLKLNAADTKLYTFRIDSFKINISTGLFDPKKHKLKFSKAIPGRHIGSGLMKIDGKQFWGTDQTLPHKAITSLNITKNDSTVFIPNSAYNDLYEPHLETLDIATGPKNVTFIKMTNSDGAGGYTIIWIFKYGKYYNRYIDTSFD